MKKFVFIGLAAALCASCRTAERSDTYVETVVEPEYVVVEDAAPVYVQDADFYKQNIVLKASGNDFVVYEYSDVRIDDVASLAIDFCNMTNPGKKAYLRDIYMHKNHKRRATFDCVDLASK